MEMEVCSACRRADDGTGLRKPRPRTAERIHQFGGESDVLVLFPKRLMASDDPLLLCKRTGCLLKLFEQRENSERAKHAGGPRKRRSSTQVPEPVAHLQRRPFDRYCTSPSAVDALVAEVSIEGVVLDMCGGRMDAVALRVGLSCTVVTNDVRNRCADTNLDSGSRSFPREYLEKAGQPDWVVTSPLYRGAINFVKSALGVARYGVALKLPLSFLEPCADRGIWLKENPPSVCVVLRRVTHTPRM
ncbi:unnamed protein product [Pylaiella littoralis]